MDELPNVHNAEGSSSAAKDNFNEVNNTIGEYSQGPEISQFDRAIGTLGMGALYYGLIVPMVAAGNIVDRARGKLMRAGYSIAFADKAANMRDPIDSPFLPRV